VNKTIKKYIHHCYFLIAKGFPVNEEDTKAFLADFKKADMNNKLDMWYYAVEQEAFWEEILTEMSMIAQAANPQKGKVVEEE
jgi:hypothetical protein